MTPDERLAEVFDRAVRNGMSSLSPVERELYLIEDFILEYEMNSLSGYFYNRLPDLQKIDATVASMRRHGLSRLATLVAEATELFRAYKEPDPPTTWNEVLRRFDPAGHLQRIDDAIRELGNYGLTDADIP